MRELAQFGNREVGQDIAMYSHTVELQEASYVPACQYLGIPREDSTSRDLAENTFPKHKAPAQSQEKQHGWLLEIQIRPHTCASPSPPMLQPKT